jgi:hypothetical protein
MMDTPISGISLSKEQVGRVLTHSNLLQIDQQESFDFQPVGVGYNNLSYYVSLENGKEYVLRLCGKHWTYLKTVRPQS